MKAAWDQVTFRVSFWDTTSGEPMPGDEMRTCTGRRYQILRIKPKSITCLVLPKDADVQGKVWRWEWNRRNRT